jgi:hypothetical protein
MGDESYSLDDCWSDFDKAVVLPFDHSVPTSNARVNIDTLIANTNKIGLLLQTVHNSERKSDDDDTFAQHSLMATRCQHNHGLCDDRMRLLAELKLKIGVNICELCAIEGHVKPCVVSIGNSFGCCEESGVQMYQALESESSLMPYRPSEEVEIFSKTAMETVHSRKGFQNIRCGYCGAKDDDTTEHELIDPGQLVKALFFSSQLTRENANRLVQAIVDAISNDTRLPLRCCSACKNLDMSLRSSTFAAYAILRSYAPSKEDNTRDKKAEADFSSGAISYEEYNTYQQAKSARDLKRIQYYKEREAIAHSIATHHALTNAARGSTSMDYDPDIDTLDDDVPTRSSGVSVVRGSTSMAYDPDIDHFDSEEEGPDEKEDKNNWEVFQGYGPKACKATTPAVVEKDTSKYSAFLPPYLSQMQDGFKVFDRHFHSSLLNAAIALRYLVDKSVFTQAQVVKVIIAIFNNSKWRMIREAGIKVQLVTRLGTMPGSPLKAMFESSNTADVHNRLGVLVEAFVEQHLHYILIAIVKGENTHRSHFVWNELLNQQSGFGIGNQSSDALMIAVFWQWMHEGFKLCTVGRHAVPELHRFDTAESYNFYNFDKWVRERRKAEKTASNRPLAEHGLFLRQTGDDQCLTATRAPSKFYRLTGYLHTEPDKLLYKSEAFCVMLPSELKATLKTHRYSKVLSVNEFRGQLLFRAASDLNLTAGISDQCIPTVMEACTFLILCPFDPSSSPGLRNADYCTKVVVAPRVVDSNANAGDDVLHTMPVDLKLHDKQKRAGEPPLLIRRAATQLPSSYLAASKLHDPQITSSHKWNLVAYRLRERVRKQRAMEAMRKSTRKTAYKTLRMVEPPETTPLAGAFIKAPSLVRTMSPVRKKKQTSSSRNATKRSSLKDMVDGEAEFVYAHTNQSKKAARVFDAHPISDALDEDIFMLPVVVAPRSVAYVTTVDTTLPVLEKEANLKPIEHGNSVDDEPQSKMSQMRSEWRHDKHTDAFFLSDNDKNPFDHRGSDDEENSTHWDKEMRKIETTYDYTPEHLMRIISCPESATGKKQNSGKKHTRRNKTAL